MADRVGQQLGNYRLLRLLGEGGFAQVYLGEQVYLKTLAAIKVLHTRLAEDDLEGFLSEARTIAALKHPHIVRVLDFGVEGGTPFLVMDFAPGGTLRERLPKGTQLSPVAILPLVQQITDALQYAHDRRLIHRDVKPENMLLDERQQIMLSDFGIATIAQSSRYQQTEGVAGTAAYMAPEQLQGKPRPASDQYALGIVIYEWLTGVRPFQGSFAEIASQHLFVPPPPLSEKLPAISPAVEQVVLRALAKDPRERFASVQDFAAAFEQACRVAPPLRPSAPINPLRERAAPSGPVQPADQPEPSWQFAPTRRTPTRPEVPLPLPPTVPAAAPPVFSATPTKTQVQSGEPLKPPPTSSGSVRGSATPSAPLPAQPRAKHRWVWGLLVGIVVLVLLSGGLVGLRLAGGGPIASLGTRATPRSALGTIKEFAVLTDNSGPSGITAGPDGNLWFTERDNQIGRITLSGTITDFALPTANSDSAPSGITAGPDGNLWFTEYYGNRIGRITPSGAITEFALPPAGGLPSGITAGPDGNLWFTAGGAFDQNGNVIGGQIGRITPEGQITEFVIPTANSDPLGIITGPDRNLWFTEYVGDKIGRITPGGQITEFALPTTNSFPWGITTGPDGNLWFTEYGANQIGRITPSGTITEFPVPTSGSVPNGIAAGPDGNLWFTAGSLYDTNGKLTVDNRIGRITPSGTITEFALPTANRDSGLSDITAGPDGNLWFTEFNANRIGWISPGP